MPSFFYCKKYYGEDLTGVERNKTAQMIIEETWWNDIQSQVAYLYDWTHDNHITQLRNLDPKNDTHKVPIDIKYIINSSQTYSKDWFSPLYWQQYNANSFNCWKPLRAM